MITRRKFIFNAALGLMVPFVPPIVAQTPAILEYRPVYSPTNIGSVGAIYDATVSASMFTTTGGSTQSTNNTVVARWEDQSGNGRNLTQATAANQPKKFDNIQGGNPIVRFDGSNDHIFTETDYPFGRNLSGVSVAAVVKAANLSCTVFGFSVGTATTTIRFRLAYDFAGSYLVGGRRLDANSNQDITAGADDGDFHVVVGVLNHAADSALIFVDGRFLTLQTWQPAGAGANSSNTDALRTVMGASVALAANLNGDIGYVVEFQKALSTAEAVGICGYLKNIWATP